MLFPLYCFIRLWSQHHYWFSLVILYRQLPQVRVYRMRLYFKFSFVSQLSLPNQLFPELSSSRIWCLNVIFPLRIYFITLLLNFFLCSIFLKICKYLLSIVTRGHWISEHSFQKVYFEIENFSFLRIFSSFKVENASVFSRKKNYSMAQWESTIRPTIVRVSIYDNLTISQPAGKCVHMIWGGKRGREKL